MPITPFKNDMPTDWGKSENREALNKNLEYVRTEFGKEYPLIIGGKEVSKENKLASYNPASHHEVIGYVSQAGKEDIEEAITAAKKAHEGWGAITFLERARYLFKAAKIMERRKPELVAWQIYEAGKNWAEADGEINEAIDFLEMYARKAIELEQGENLVTIPGIENHLEYKPLGVGAVISPWNFPLAIVTGMTVSAIVTGNTVLLKPASLTPIVAAKFMEIMHEAGVPDGVINYIPGSSREIGDDLVTHRDINFISFTGSMEAGLHIDELAHKRIPNQRWVKRVVAEMGGKNGIVVDESADLDAAADGIVTSAFGYQGQKCSAGSRAIIHESVYNEMVDKIVERTKKLHVGPGTENNPIGPVIDDKAFKNINEYIEIGKEEGKLAFGGNSDNTEGYYITPTIFKDVAPGSRIMKEEIFGPVLAICKASSVEEGIDVYNDTQFGLTGALYTNNREQISYARRKMECGNLFLNGKCTGALVGIQPFGGYYMSGTGEKTGTLEYLLHFVQAKTIAENF
ncbi:1-pyrroline-5-carboxylate dehydrogenase [Oceanobacillus oncorhynchi subsp. incaldanensis]|uniref:L-glutamate gamma-semialdehyde dehydrogenase n=1 Tax=Oceanobacillus oncorhynchi TaxID=545501 RepID=A0A0A1MIZ2_9BACI|nr:1-pyrroline-5-carboxylate dehydrogenase [Oceanobacillus oncorhynchi subsp. incaldanensis]CEI83058.1 1-pyrroline-5-carboxylate dehydrogenase 1 [Oceanobacillus oncorhynchi]